MRNEDKKWGVFGYVLGSESDFILRVRGLGTEASCIEELVLFKKI